MASTELINDWVDDIRRREGDGFAINTEAVQKELLIQSSAFSNITIKVLSVVGGILAALFFLGFLGVAGLFDSEKGLLITGLVFIAAAIVAYKIIQNLVLDTAGICFYIIGVLLVANSLSSLIDSKDAVSAVLVAIALITLFFTEGFMLIILGVLLFNTGLISFFVSRNDYQLIQLPALLTVFTFLWITFNEAGIISYSPKANRIYKPLQAGFFLSFLLELLTAGQFRNVNDTNVNYLILSAGIWLGIIFMLYRILKATGTRSVLNKVIIYGLALAFLAPTIYAPYLSGSVLLLLITFHFGYKTEWVLSLLLLIYGTSRYYYDLNITLLMKSAILFFSGIVFLITWLFLKSKINRHEKI